MNKIFIVLMMSLLSLNASLINAISVIVNNEAITLVDIDNKMQTDKLSNKEAIQALIDEILYKQEIKKHNISVDIFDTNKYIEQLAKQNNMKVYELKSAIKQQQNYDEFEKDIKNKIKHQKLISSIASGKIIPVSDDDMKIYYDNNLHQFRQASKVDIKVYISKNKNSLMQISKNPMLMQNDVNIQDITLKYSELNPKIAYIISNTKENNFSSIFLNNKAYNMMYVIKKYDVKNVEFENAKNKIFEILMKKRQDEYLKNYFEILRQSANIKFLR